MALAFHPGGRVAAVLADASRGTGTARLVEVETGRVLAALELPNPAMTYAMAFSPDGRSLALSQTDQRVHVWDLALIRRRLDELGLAAAFPDFSGGEVAPAGTAAVADVGRIEVLGADPAGLRRLAIGQVLREGWRGVRMMADAGLDDAEDLSRRAARWRRLGHPELAEADYRASLARRPDSVPTAYDLAWCLLYGRGRYNPYEAAHWARRAIELDPDYNPAQLILGRALYEARRYAEAADQLEANIRRAPSDAGYDWLRLAICRHRLGRPAAARAAVAEAVRWRAAWPEKNPASSALFGSLLREARSVLAETVLDLPDDVFAR
jgi:hypothetical protein